MKKCIRGEVPLAAGLDVGDRMSHLVVVTQGNRVTVSEPVATEEAALSQAMARFPGIRVALETGTHSPWVARLLKSQGHEVLICNARELKLISSSRKKNDRRDAEMLARVARMDPQLLQPIEPRGEQVQKDMQVLSMRDLLVRQRTAQILQVRGLAKSLGFRIGKSDAKNFPAHARRDLPEALQMHFEPALRVIGQLSLQIREYDRQIDRMCREVYPQTRYLLQIPGVGPLAALAYVLWIEDPTRFDDPRQVGAYLGLCPGQDQSGKTSRKLPITRQGHELVRRLLVQCAHYILGHFGKPCQLRSQGERLMARGGGAPPKKAVTAVARKLSVVMLVLWRDRRQWEPFPGQSRIA